METLTPTGFQCPHCGSQSSIVTETRRTKRWIRRRRRCVRCGERFTTREKVEEGESRK